MPKQPYQIKGATYFWLNTWIMANVIQLATIDFCKKFLNHKNDPCGRLYDQMTQAARSGTANIAEGNARHFTSRETEMKLTDVAKASIEELAGDYYTWLLSHGQIPWSTHNQNFQNFSNIQISKPEYQDDVNYESAQHILKEKTKLAAWVCSDDSFIAANSLLILCQRLNMMLIKQMETMMNSFRIEGGFTETLTTERLEARTNKSTEEGAPKCPNCGRPMIKRMARKGINSGHEFWSCPAYPDCLGTRSI